MVEIQGIPIFAGSYCIGRADTDGDKLVVVLDPDPMANLKMLVTYGMAKGLRITIVDDLPLRKINGVDVPEVQ